jgi:N-acetylglutamate synthase/N-acetylornithine aminotransferase
VLQGVRVFAHGAAHGLRPRRASRPWPVRGRLLEIALTEGDGAADLMTSDLGYRYVEVNAEYTT